MHPGFMWGPGAQQNASTPVTVSTAASTPVAPPVTVSAAASTPVVPTSTQSTRGPSPVSTPLRAHIYDSGRERARDGSEDGMPRKRRRIVTFDTDDMDQGSDMGEMDFEEKAEEISYRKKIEFGYEVLGKQQPKEQALYDEALDFEKKEHKGLMIFPIAKAVDQSFREAWNAACGEKDYKWGANLNPPQKATKSKDSVRSAPAKAPKLKFYKIENERDGSTEPKWPTSSLKVDANFQSNVTNRQMNKPKKSATDDWMDATGKIILMQNQALFFTEVQQKIMADQIDPALNALEETVPMLIPDDDDAGETDRREVVESMFNAVQDLKEGWRNLKDIVSTRNKTLQDMTKTATNTMVNLVVVKRGEVLADAGLTHDEAEVLKHAESKAPVQWETG